MQAPHIEEEWPLTPCNYYTLSQAAQETRLGYILNRMLVDHSSYTRTHTLWALVEAPNSLTNVCVKTSTEHGENMQIIHAEQWLKAPNLGGGRQQHHLLSHHDTLPTSQYILKDTNTFLKECVNTIFISTIFVPFFNMLRLRYIYMHNTWNCYWPLLLNLFWMGQNITWPLVPSWHFSAHPVFIFSCWLECLASVCRWKI